MTSTRIAPTESVQHLCRDEPGQDSGQARQRQSDGPLPEIDGRLAYGRIAGADGKLSDRGKADGELAQRAKNRSGELRDGGRCDDELTHTEQQAGGELGHDHEPGTCLAERHASDCELADRHDAAGDAPLAGERILASNRVHERETEQRGLAASLEPG